MNLPLDVRRYIVLYTDDIDLRRKFKIYKKIKINKFFFLETIIRNNYNYQINGFTRYKFISNQEKELNRQSFCINDDLVDTLIKIDKHKVYIELHIFKLRKKKFNNYYYPKNIYNKVLTNNYYWDYIEIDYEIT